MGFAVEIRGSKLGEEVYGRLAHAEYKRARRRRWRANGEDEVTYG